jgi:hypothetical protein
MSKYKSKQQLLDEIGKEKPILDTLILSLDAEKASRPGACDDWSVKDILCHLVEWHRMVLSWYREGSAGKTPEVPGRGYKWSQLPDLNREICERYKQTSWDEAKDLFADTFGEVFELIQTMDEQTMLTPAYQPWMNQNTLIAYFGSCTSSHYKWATGLIKKFIKTLG